MAAFPLTPTLPPIVRGRYWSGVFIVEVAGTVIDPSGYTWSGQVRPEVGVTPVTDITVAATSTNVAVSLAEADTAALTTDTVAVGFDITIGGHTTQIVKTTVRVEDPVEV